MGRGNSSGGGQSSLGYLFGGEADSNTQQPPPQPKENPPTDAPTTEPSHNSPEPASSDDKTTAVTDEESSEKPASESSYNVINRNPNAAVHDNMTNNYHRPDGQNCGNYITNRPSTKVHAAPGGNSSLGYLFNDDRK